MNPYFDTMIGAARLSNGGSSTVFAWAAGGGIDIKVHKNLATRVIDMTYLLLRDNGFNSGHGRLSSGLVWGFGGR